MRINMGHNNDLKGHLNRINLFNGLLGELDNVDYAMMNENKLKVERPFLTCMNRHCCYILIKLIIFVNIRTLYAISPHKIKSIH